MSGAWSTIGELAERHSIDGQYIRRAIAAGEVNAVRHEVLRVDPASWSAWLHERLK